MTLLPSFINDLKTPEPQLSLERITTHARFSLSYTLLLISSSVICTLGLLLDVSAIVIGGMIISPLMWPLMKISLGINFEVKSYIKHAMVLLLISILIGFLSATIITFASPLKFVNSEILARTNPTLLDVFVAIAAGLIAALAVSKEKISDTLAGVAIATSLMPPLCVAGIGAALFDTNVFFGSLFLFLINIISIIFVATLAFFFFGLKKSDESSFRYRGILTVAALLALVAVPLFFMLQNYSIQLDSYHRVSDVLEEEIGSISSLAGVENVETQVQGFSAVSAVLVEADVLIPEGVSVDYEKQQDIVRRLEEATGREVDLNLRVQRAISVTSKEEEELDQTRETIIEEFRKEVLAVNPSLSIDSLSVENNGEKWTVDSVLRGDPSQLFTQEELESIENRLSGIVEGDNATVEINMDIVPLLRLKSKPELEIDLIKNNTERFIDGMSDGLDVLSVESAEASDNRIILTVTVRAPENYEVSGDSVRLFKDFLEDKYKKNITIKLDIITKNLVEY